MSRANYLPKETTYDKLVFPENTRFENEDALRDAECLDLLGGDPAELLELLEEFYEE